MASSPIRILIVEDEKPLADAVRYHLERESYEVDVAPDGRRALELFADRAHALVILDLMLPELPGLDVCRAIRPRSTVPIIIVTAKDAEADKVTGLELGADDYVTKPFSVRELVSRVRANLRRIAIQGAPAAEGTLEAGPVLLDLDRHEARVNGDPVVLPPKEFELLACFLRHPGRLLTRDRLIQEVWGSDYVGDTRTLDVHVKRLREKVEPDPHAPTYLETVRGLGYRFVG